MIRNGPFNYYYWDQVAAIEALGFFIFVALVFAPINLKWNFPVILNIVLDLFLPPFIIPWATNMYTAWSNNNWYIERDYYGKKPPVDKGPACHAMLLAVEILIGIAAGLAFLVG